MRISLPEATKKFRLVKSLGLMNKYLTEKDKTSLTKGFNTFRPYHVSDRLRTLIHCINTKTLRDRNTLRTVYDNLRQRNLKMKTLTKLFKDGINTTAMDAFKKLRNNRENMIKIE